MANETIGKYTVRCFGRFCKEWDWKHRHDFQGLFRFYRADSLYMRNYKGVVVEESGKPVAFLLANDGSGMISPYRKTPPVVFKGKTYVKLEYAEVSPRSGLLAKPKLLKSVLESAVSELVKCLGCDGLFLFGDEERAAGFSVVGNLKGVKMLFRDLSEPVKRRLG